MVAGSWKSHPASDLRCEISKNYKSKGTEYASISNELNEEFERCLRHHASNPTFCQLDTGFVVRSYYHTKDKNDPFCAHSDLTRGSGAPCLSCTDSTYCTTGAGRLPGRRKHLLCRSSPTQDLTELRCLPQWSSTLSPHPRLPGLSSPDRVCVCFSSNNGGSIALRSRPLPLFVHRGEGILCSIGLDNKDANMK